MNDQQHQPRTPPSPPHTIPIAPARTRTTTNNQQTNASIAVSTLVHSYSFQQQQQMESKHPPPSASNNAAKLAQRSAVAVTGSMQELNNIQNSGNTIQNVILNAAGRTFNINSSAGADSKTTNREPPQYQQPQQQFNKYDEMLTFDVLNGEEVIEGDDGNDELFD